MASGGTVKTSDVCERGEKLDRKCGSHCTYPLGRDSFGKWRDYPGEQRTDPGSEKENY